MLKCLKKEDTYGISKKFFLGGATAANQYEGGYLEGTLWFNYF